eukprot:3935801-Rhodomonas_salina.1
MRAGPARCGARAAASSRPATSGAPVPGPTIKHRAQRQSLKSLSLEGWGWDLVVVAARSSEGASDVAERRKPRRWQLCPRAERRDKNQRRASENESESFDRMLNKGRGAWDVGGGCLAAVDEREFAVFGVGCSHLAS